MTQYLYAGEVDLYDFYLSSKSMLSADMDSTINDLGAFSMLSVVRYAQATADYYSLDFHYACEKPWKFPELWYPCVIAAGYDLRGVGHYKISADFTVGEDGTLTLEDEEEVA